MKGKIVNTVKYLLFLGIGIALMYFAFRNVNPARMLRDLSEAHYGWILFSLVFSLAAHLSRAYRWAMLIEAAHHKPAFSRSFYALMMGYFANMAFPRLGEVTRCTVLYETEKTPIDALVGTVIAERVIDLITLLCVIMAALLINMQLFSGFFLGMAQDKLSVLNNISMPMFITLVVIFFLLIAVLFVLRKQFMRNAVVKAVLEFLKGIAKGFKAVLKVKNLKLFLFHSVLIWLMYYISGYVTFFAMPETQHLDWVAALFVLALGALGMSAPVQGGFGAYHIMVSSGLVLYNITSYTDPQTGEAVDKGLVYATIVHSSQVLLILALGTFSLIMLNIYKRKQLALADDKQ